MYVCMSWLAAKVNIVQYPVHIFNLYFISSSIPISSWLRTCLDLGGSSWLKVIGWCARYPQRGGGAQNQGILNVIVEK